MSAPDVSHIVNFPPDYPELLDQMGQIVSRNLHGMGFPPENAKHGAFQIMEEIRTELGGGMYLPKGRDYELSKRDAQIFDKWRGNNYPELAREFGLTDMQIRNIVRRGLLRLRAKQQRPFFDDKGNVVIEE